MGFGSRARERYEYVNERDRRWILSLSIERLERYLVPPLVSFLLLNFLDVATTLIAMQSPSFRELNPVAAALFAFGTEGFVAALLLKYSPAFVLIYITLMKDSRGAHPVLIRGAKLAAIAVLVAGNVFYVFVVGSNLGNLLRLYY